MLATGDVEHPGDKKTASRPSLNTPLQSPACTFLSPYLEKRL